MKRKTKVFFKSFYISFVIIMCIVFGWLGISAAYENTVKTAFGEYKSAIEINDTTFRILDFVIWQKDINN